MGSFDVRKNRDDYKKLELGFGRCAVVYRSRVRGKPARMDCFSLRCAGDLT